ncbi:hypothetical protein ACO0LE_20215, partial [Undibacterium sp. Xuan67W]
MTGIIDENNARFATWTYDNYGNAISSEHGTGIEKVTFNYLNPANTASTGASGVTQNYTIELVNGYARISAISVNCGLNCTYTSKK